MNSSFVWEDDENLFIREEAIPHLPPEIRENLQKRLEQGNKLLEGANEDLRNLIKLGRVMPTIVYLKHIHTRLSSTKFEPTIESVLEHEMLTTAFVVTYARLFAEGKGVSGMTRKKIPNKLRDVHDHLIKIRNERYAHNGMHESLGDDLSIYFGDSEFHVSIELKLDMYVGGRNEWGELVMFIDEYMYNQTQKILERLKVATGYNWIYYSDHNSD